MAEYIEKLVWNEVTTRPPTEEENDEFKRIYDEDLCFVFDCLMPDDGQEILIATKYGIDRDVCFVDGGTYLEERGDWDDVIAWAEMPKYKGGETDG